MTFLGTRLGPSHHGSVLISLVESPPSRALPVFPKPPAFASFTDIWSVGLAIDPGSRFRASAPSGGCPTMKMMTRVCHQKMALFQTGPWNTVMSPVKGVYGHPKCGSRLLPGPTSEQVRQQRFDGVGAVQVPSPDTVARGQGVHRGAVGSAILRLAQCWTRTASVTCFRR